MHTETRDIAFFRKQLERITNTILQPFNNIADAIRNTEDYYALLKEAALFDAQSEGSRDDIILSTGKAIAPVWAAHCVQDVRRTRVFIRGIIQAVYAARKQFQDEPLQLLYVGPGPFAPLVLPLTTLFKPEDIQFRFLEINPLSIALLENTIRAFGIEDYVAAIEQTDAATYQVSSPVHILVVETMQEALRQEPQVAVTLHLAPQIVPGGFLIPESISVAPGLIDGRRHTEYLLAQEPGPRNYYVTTEPVLQISQEFARAYTATKPVHFPQHHTVFTKKQLQTYPHPALFTEIKVFGSEILAYWDSPLTEPYLLTLPTPLNGDIELVTQYEISDTPKLRCTWVKILF
ncbi:MAG: hypothetical protein WCR52_06935 [Bacteroidota bacterium]